MKFLNNFKHLVTIRFLKKKTLNKRTEASFLKLFNDAQYNSNENFTVEIEKILTVMGDIRPGWLASCKRGITVKALKLHLFDSCVKELRELDKLKG